MCGLEVNFTHKIGCHSKVPLEIEKNNFKLFIYSQSSTNLLLYYFLVVYDSVIIVIIFVIYPCSLISDFLSNKENINVLLTYLL